MDTEIVERIHRLSELSENVQEFVQNSYWNYDEELREMIETPSIMSDILHILLEEIKDYGITLVSDEPEYFLDNYRNECIDLIRTYLSPGFLVEHFSSMNKDEINSWKRFLFGKDIKPYYEDNDLSDVQNDMTFERFITYLYQTHPMKKDLEKLKYYSHEWTINSSFIHYMLDIVLTSITEATLDSEDTFKTTMEYVIYKKGHIDNVKTALTSLINTKLPDGLTLTKEQVNEVLNYRIPNHDIDLMDMDNISDIAFHWSLRRLEDRELYPDQELLSEAYRKDTIHHMTSRHHIEFYSSKAELNIDKDSSDYIDPYEMSLVDIYEIVADVYDKQKTSQEFVEDVKKEVLKPGVPKDVTDRILKVAETLNLW